MPYIKQEARDGFEIGPEGATAGLYFGANTAGELNYQFTAIAVEYIKRCGLNYQNINDVVGALEGAKLEFYRRVAAPYEDKKIKENGDVY
jgi:hypothetical protein